MGLQILAKTRSQKALQQAHHAAALISGASAGAMLLCSHAWSVTPELEAAISRRRQLGPEPDEEEIPVPLPLMGLGFVPGALCWPHAAALFTLKSLRQVGLPQSVTALAIDDQTAAVTDSTDTWQVLGRGQVTLVDESFVPQVYHAGQQFKLRVSVSQR